MEQGVKANRVYSIWSLLVIMTLLAMWLAIPRRCAQGVDYSGVLFFTSHQIAGWVLISGLIWKGTGKRRVVLGVLMVALLAAWLPAVCVVLTKPFSADLLVAEVLMKAGLIDAYDALYSYLDRSFGYGLYK